MAAPCLQQSFEACTTADKSNKLVAEAHAAWNGMDIATAVKARVGGPMKAQEEEGHPALVDSTASAAC